MTLSAQLVSDPNILFGELKDNIKGAKSSKELNYAVKSLEEFLSQVRIEKNDSMSHNEIPYLTCYYNSIPLTTTAVLKHDSVSDTILFEKGVYYITKDIESDTKVSILQFDKNLFKENKSMRKKLDQLIGLYEYQIGNIHQSEDKTLFFVKDEKLYYAAIGSQKIPPFAILSNSGIINYATCFKTILKASNIDSSYDDIFSNYLKSTIDEKFVPIKNIDGYISNRRVKTTIIHQNKIDASVILKELMNDRFMVAVDMDGNVGLLSALALTSDSDLHPVHVRLRLPILTTERQRTQLSWEKFVSQTIALIKVDIY